jgi:hypothetical protein
MRRFAMFSMLLQGCFSKNHCVVESVNNKLKAGIEVVDPIARTMENFVRHHHRFPEVWEFDEEYERMNGNKFSYVKLPKPYKVKPWPLRGPRGEIFTFTYEENDCVFVCDYRTNPYYIHTNISKYVTESEFQKEENRPKGWFCSVYDGPDTIHR